MNKETWIYNKKMTNLLKLQSLIYFGDVLKVNLQNGN